MSSQTIKRSITIVLSAIGISFLYMLVVLAWEFSVVRELPFDTRLLGVALKASVLNGIIGSVVYFFSRRFYGEFLIT